VYKLSERDNNETERRLTTLEIRLAQAEKDISQNTQTMNQINAKLDQLLREGAIQKAILTKSDRALIYSGMFGSLTIAMVTLIVHFF
jgi:uncharacterized coiled-coil protein SlyX